MDAKGAIARAKEYFADLFTDETVTEIGLEEVEYDQIGLWRITIGFARAKYPLNRWYKVVTLDDQSGEFISLKNRESVLN